MTRKHALEILIRAAAQSCAGVGQGIRTLPTAEQRAEVIEAIKRVWPYRHHACTDTELRNLGL